MVHSSKGVREPAHNDGAKESASKCNDQNGNIERNACRFRSPSGSKESEIRNTL